MSANIMVIFWGILSVSFAIFEAVTIQLVSIWFMIGSATALLSACLNAPLWLQITLFGVVSVLSLCLTRPVAKRYLNSKIEPTNSDRCIGKTGLVVETIDNINETGQIKVNGQIWSAKSENNEIIEKGTLIIVSKIDGVKTIVKNKNKEV